MSSLGWTSLYLIKQVLMISFCCCWFQQFNKKFVLCFINTSQEWNIFTYLSSILCWFISSSLQLCCLNANPLLSSWEKELLTGKCLFTINVWMFPPGGQKLQLLVKCIQMIYHTLPQYFPLMKSIWLDHLEFFSIIQSNKFQIFSFVCSHFVNKRQISDY